LLNAELLRGRCVSPTGEIVRVAPVLEPVIGRCADERLARVVVDSGPQLEPVVEILYEASTFPLMRPFLRQVRFAPNGGRGAYAAEDDATIRSRRPADGRH
jgi:serine/threonine-protein kinase PknK